MPVANRSASTSRATTAAAPATRRSWTQWKMFSRAGGRKADLADERARSSELSGALKMAEGKLSTPPSSAPLATPQATDIPARLAQAIAAHRKGDLSAAQAAYEEILELQPAHFDALHLAGVIAIQRMDAHSGTALIRRAL